MKPLSLLVIAALGSSISLQGEDAPDLRFYTGTYTGANSKGIYLCRLSLKSGAVTIDALAAEMPNPTYPALHPGRQFLYAVNEVANFEGKDSGAVSAFAIDQGSGKLTLLNQQPSGGGGPCHIAIDNTGASALVANYGGGSSSCLPIEKDGRLGASTAFFSERWIEREPAAPGRPHAHCATFEPGNRFAFICDLGLDKVLGYAFDAATGAMTLNEAATATLKPGAGPRHLAFHPSGRHAYVINELDSTVTALAWEGQKWSIVETLSTLPEGWTGSNSTAEIKVHPGGRFVYGSNRGHDSIAVFGIDEKTGKLIPVEHVSTGGRTPRDFALDPTGTFLVVGNQETNNLVSFRVEPATGRLTSTGDTPGIDAPVCIVFAPPA